MRKRVWSLGTVGVVCFAGVAYGQQEANFSNSSDPAAPAGGQASATPGTATPPIPSTSGSGPAVQPAPAHAPPPAAASSVTPAPTGSSAPLGPAPVPNASASSAAASETTLEEPPELRPESPAIEAQPAESQRAVVVKLPPEKPAAHELPVSSRYDWNIGGGFSFSSSAAPSFVAGVETQLWRGSWLLLDGRFIYQDGEADISTLDGQERPFHTTTTTASAALGMRHQFNRNLVSFSGYWAIAGSMVDTGGDSPKDGDFIQFPLSGSGQKAVGVFAGFVAERQLLEALALRLNLGLLDTGYSWSRQLIYDSGRDEIVVQRGKGYHADIRPQISLRLHMYL